jgi:dodecin
MHDLPSFGSGGADALEVGREPTGTQLAGEGDRGAGATPEDTIPMADVVKVIELVGNSPNSFSDAVKSAVATASETIRGITGVDVISSNAAVENGEITQYKVQVKIAFVVDSGSVSS